MAVLPPQSDADDRYRERVGLGPLRPRVGVATPATLAPKTVRRATSDDGSISDPSALLGMPPARTCAMPVGYEERALALVSHEREAMAGLLGELRDRLHTLETRAAHEDRRTLPRGFSFTAGANCEYRHTYCPLEAEIAFGLVVWPVPGLWIENIQVGRQMFTEPCGLDPKSDLRELLARDRGGIVLYPSVGMTLGVRNHNSHPLLVEGAVFVIPLESTLEQGQGCNTRLQERTFPIHPCTPIGLPPHTRMIEVAIEDGAQMSEGMALLLTKRAHGMILTRVRKGVYRATFQDARIDPDGHESWAKQCMSNGMRPWPNACESFISIENQTGVMQMMPGPIEAAGFDVFAYGSCGEPVDPIAFTVIVTTPQR